MWQPGWGRSLGGMDTGIGMAEPLHCSLDTQDIVNRLYSNTK